MSGYLVDTNVISEFARPKPEGEVVDWVLQVDSDLLYASVITLGELQLGIQQLPASKKRSDLEHWLATGLPEWFASNLLPVTTKVAERWATLMAEARRKGTPLATADALIAATAAHHSLTLVTRNTKDFVNLGISLVNPWLRNPA